MRSKEAIREAVDLMTADLLSSVPMSPKWKSAASAAGALAWALDLQEPPHSGFATAFGELLDTTREEQRPEVPGG